MGFNTGLLHGRFITKNPGGDILPPVSQVAAFRYDSMEELERVFQHKAMGYAYSRIGNPTVSAFEQKVNVLEEGAGAICCSSGMAAITSAILAVCKSGDEIITSCGLYGGSIDLFHDLAKLGIKTVFTEDMTAENLKGLINDRTRVVFAELISNPSLKVANVPKVSEVTHSAGVPLFIDSTIATPFIAQPLKLGADVVIHSTSKYINGGGNSIGGVIVDGGKFAWDFDKFEALSEFKKYGRAAFSVRLRTDIWENLGGCMAPVNAWLNYIGLDTLGLRMERICKNADLLAHALEKLQGISVSYLTLDSHPYHEYVEKELNGYGGGILSFRAGSKEKAFKIINSLKYGIVASNIGDIRTLVIHPASTLYIRNSKEEMEKAGVYEDTIRVSVGIEDPEDLIADFTDAIENS